MAEIILEPTALSKVIPLSLKTNEVDSSLVGQLITNSQFNTADTDAWFSFTLDGLAATTGTFDLALINLQDKSVFNHTDKVFNTNPFYYKLDSGANELTNEIRHAGKWVGQLVVTLPNGDSATRKFIFSIEGHILDGTVVKTILLEDYNTLIADIEASKDTLTQYNIDYASLIGTVTDQEEARVQAEELRVVADALRETKEGLRQTTFEANEVIRNGAVESAIEGEMIAQNVATKLTEKEATYAPRLVSVEQQLEQTNILSAEAVAKADAMASGSPKGVYATLALLQAAYPTGTTGAYLVTADGKWYYWSGSAWVVGGVYQATGISDNSITLTKLAGNIAVPGKNLFDKTKAQTGYTIIGGTGVIATGASYFVTDFIRVSASTTYKIGGNHPGNSVNYSFYDINKSFISGTQTSTFNPSFETTSATVYVKANGRIEYIDTYQIELGSVSTEYEVYKTQYSIQNLKVSDTSVLDAISSNANRINLLEQRKSYISTLDANLVSVASHRTSIINSDFTGANNTNYTSETGLYSIGYQYGRVLNCVFSNFKGGYGLRVGQTAGSSTLTGNDLVFISNNVGFCSEKRAEYITISNSQFSGNSVGARITGGNVHLSNCMIDDNVNGIEILSGENDGHGIISGCQINHNSTGYGLIIDGISNGETISDCHFYDSKIWLKNTITKAIRFDNCVIASGLTIENCAKVIFNNCYFTSAISGSNLSIVNSVIIGTGNEIENSALETIFNTH